MDRDPQLAAMLRGIAARVESGALRGPELARLESALGTAAACAKRNASVRRLAELLDPGLMPRWALAGKVAAALDGFEASGAWGEIQAGRRPRSTFEAVCSAVLACPGARTQRRIYPLLTDD